MVMWDTILSIFELITSPIFIIASIILCYTHYQKAKQLQNIEKSIYPMFLLIFAIFLFVAEEHNYKVLGYAETSKIVRLIQWIPFIASPLTGLYFYFSLRHLKGKKQLLDKQ